MIEYTLTCTHYIENINYIYSDDMGIYSTTYPIKQL